VQLGVIAFLWFRSMMEGDGIQFERNFFTKILYLLTILIILFEIFIAFLEYRSLVELTTSVLMWAFKATFLISGPSAPFSLILYLRTLLSFKYLFDRLKPSAFVQSTLLYQVSSLFFNLTSHRACPYTLPFAEALQGFSEFSPKASVVLLTLSTLSTVIIGVLMVPYMVTSERPVKVRRKGYEIKRAKVLAERREAENGERRHIAWVLKHYVVFQLISMGVELAKAISKGGTTYAFVYSSMSALLSLCLCSVFLYKPIPPPAAKPVVVKFFDFQRDAPPVNAIRGEDEEAGIGMQNNRSPPGDWATPPHSVSTNEEDYEY